MKITPNSLPNKTREIFLCIYLPFYMLKWKKVGGVRVPVHTIEGKIEQLQMEKTYIYLQTKDFIMHLPITTEVIDWETGDTISLHKIPAQSYFRLYRLHGQYVLFISEKSTFYGLYEGIYNEMTSCISDVCMIRHSAQTKKYGARLTDGAYVIALCKITTRSIPPQSTPTALFVFRKNT